MKRVMMYTTDQCSLCTSAKALLERRGISYTEVNLSKDPDGRAKLAQCTGLITFPQIVIDDQPLGGFNELIAADKEGRLTDLMAA
jgi:glutaredoxin 3